MTNPSVEMREFALKLADFDLSRALLLKGADEIEQARRTGAFWKAEKIASESENERLRGALEKIAACDPMQRAYTARDIAVAALSGEPHLADEPSARRSGELLPCENCGHGIVAHVQNGGNCPTPPLKSSAVLDHRFLPDGMDPGICQKCGSTKTSHRDQQ